MKRRTVWGEKYRQEFADAMVLVLLGWLLVWSIYAMSNLE